VEGDTARPIKTGPGGSQGKEGDKGSIEDFRE